MNVRDEIRLYAAERDKPILDWLFGRYHYESQWTFVARCSFQRYGDASNQVRRVWRPTIEGAAIYAQLFETKD